MALAEPASKPCASLVDMASILTRYAGALKSLPKTTIPFRLMDVGCSGGIDTTFLTQTFPILEVDGFDPLVEEIARLNSLKLPGHRYHNYFVVGTEESEEVENLKSVHLSGTSFHLTSAFAAQETLRPKGSSYTQEVFNSGAAPSFAKERTTVSDFLTKARQKSPNFLKIDTDGHDYYVLEGARVALEDYALLGVQIECQFHGTPSLNHNTFSNIDELMRRSGFSLFALETHKYSRAELPQPFVWDLFGQTTSGQVQWGEAVYFRDPTLHPEFLTYLSENEPELAHFLRLLLYFELPDVAAAAIAAVSKIKTSHPTWFEEFLDQIVPVNLIGASTHKSYLVKFDGNPELFFPRHWRFPGSQIRLLLEGLARRIKGIRF